MFNLVALLTSGQFTLVVDQQTFMSLICFQACNLKFHPLLLSIEDPYWLLGKVGSISDCKGRIQMRCDLGIWKCEMDEDKG